MPTPDLERGLQSLALTFVKERDPAEAFSAFRDRAIARFGGAAKPLIEKVFSQAKRDLQRGTRRHRQPAISAGAQRKE
ncbi:hypothetical protein L6654_24155 [Bradyrhizobium sp. WYCCWR 13023]|uniref:Uncharacterized protein n=1 Tax=Bradyrhizobium zhengyangense TaxID=2911009 RepID=A0A9X1RC18_9BRAD|nr:hypothetical protein [Bradyrhizobium zhengyangense]MCG2629721.1 hypothetical protein [Bradyrhizobium zhengyangense]